MTLRPDDAPAAPEAPTEPVRTLTPRPLGDRPVRTRRTARVLLIDPAERVLLFSDIDPNVPEVSWWITPGGGLDPGESARAAALREVSEETGLSLSPGELIGPVWVRRVVHGYSDVTIHQHDVFFGARVPRFVVDDAGHTPEERITMTSNRWFARSELAGGDETIWPANLGSIWDEFARHVADPGRYPIDRTANDPDDESSVEWRRPGLTS